VGGKSFRAAAEKLRFWKFKYLWFRQAILLTDLDSLSSSLELYLQGSLKLRVFFGSKFFVLPPAI
jgi:hypothetical protein